MKVVYVVDSILNLTEKINLIKSKFGNEIRFVVNGKFVPFFETFSYPIHAVYNNELSVIIHKLLQGSKLDDVVICYSSLDFNEKLLDKFILNIKDKTKIVNIIPKYSSFENICNSLYNKYVQSIFNLKDSLASSKLQFLPKDCVADLLNSHIANRLFDFEEERTRTITINHKEIANSSKTKTFDLKLLLLLLITTLSITIGLMLSIAYLKIKFVGILFFTCLYILNFFIFCMLYFKRKFDKRFLK